MPALTHPSGDVTLMFTDIEGSTRLWETYQEGFHNALQRHDALLRVAITESRGYEVKTIGDSFMVAFYTPEEAVRCALRMQELIEADGFGEVGGVRVRIGLHTGSIEPYAGDYHGPLVNRCQRTEDAGHGGMILLSEETAQRVEKNLPEGAALVEVGLHRLKDLGVPQRLFRLLHPNLPERDYPPLRTLDALPHNFPAQVNSFVGRQREIGELKQLLIARRQRLITLTGPGGTGKTRLAMQIAVDNLQHFPGGVWLVELANVTDPREVPATVARALRTSNSRSTAPTIESDTDARTQVFTLLRGRRSLLVLDNFEQVIEAARFVSEILRECPDTCLLITSRHLLQITGEREYPVAPMEAPPEDVTVENGMNYDSIRLFVERGQLLRPDFTLTEESVAAVAEICRRLDGIPLAVELTASLMRGMTPQQILPRLDRRFQLLASQRGDLEPRQRSLRGAMDWSYELLTEDERKLFGELAVFAGGFTIEDVEEVCRAEDAFTLVFNLRDKSLLKTDEVFGETRYSMLETLREYAQEKLHAAGNGEALRERHAHYFLLKSEAQVQELRTGNALEALRRMTVDIDNMRSGIVWAQEKQDADRIARYSVTLARYYLRRGPYTEAEHWLQIGEASARILAEKERAVANPDSGSGTGRLGSILLQHGLLHYRRANYGAASIYFAECLPLLERVGDWEQSVSCLGNMGTISWATRDYEQAHLRWEKALATAREHHTRHEGDLLTNLAMLAGSQGEFATARANFEQAISWLQNSDVTEGLAYAYLNLGEMLLLEYDNLPPTEQAQRRDALLVLAGRHLEEANELSIALSNSEAIGQTTERMGRLALMQGDLQRAETLCHQALSTSEASGDLRCQISARLDLGRIIMKRAQTTGQITTPTAHRESAVRCLRQAFTLASHINDAEEIARVAQCAGELAEQCGEDRVALQAYLVACREFQQLQPYISRRLLSTVAELLSPFPSEEKRGLQKEAETLTPTEAIEAAFRVAVKPLR